MSFETDRALVQRLLGKPDFYPPEFKSAIPRILQLDASYKVLLRQLPDLTDPVTAILTAGGYATQAWVNSQGFATQAWVNSQGFATQAWVASQGYLTAVTAAATYETQAHAASTYETQSHASSTYETQSHASSTYSTIATNNTQDSRLTALEALNISYSADSTSRTCSDRTGTWVEPSTTVRILSLAAGDYLLLGGGVAEMTASSASALTFGFGVGVNASDPTSNAQTWAGISTVLNGATNDYDVESYVFAVTATLSANTTLHHMYKMLSSNGGTVALNQKNRWLAAIPYS